MKGLSILHLIVIIAILNAGVVISPHVWDSSSNAVNPQSKRILKKIRELIKILGGRRFQAQNIHTTQIRDRRWANNIQDLFRQANSNVSYPRIRRIPLPRNEWPTS